MDSYALRPQRIIRERVPLWALVILPLAGAIAWAVNAGSQALKNVVLGGLTWAMAMPLFISLEAGLIGMMLFEPLRGFLRRFQYLFLPYYQTDTIHVVTPLVTLLALGMLLQQRGLKIIRETPLAGLVSLLALIYFLQMFNPLQGALTVGFSGALFMLVPIAWFYFGQAVKENFIETVFRLMVVLGLITSLHGLYQLAFGFPNFERFWVENTEFYRSIDVGNVKRALATFSSAEEWGRYVELGALIALGYGATAISRKARAGWFTCGIALSGILLLTGQRTAMFGLLLGIVVLLLSGARTWRSAVARLGVVIVPVLLVGFLAQAPSSGDELRHDENERFQTLLTHTARGTLRPTEEDSLQERFKNWSYLATDLIPYRFYGLGLGATTLGASRFESELDLPPIDSYFLSAVITSGVIAGLIFLWILIKATRISWRAYRQSEPGSVEARVWRIAASLMPVLILNSFFGNTFMLYSVAPIAWLLIGWISAESQREFARATAVEANDPGLYHPGVAAQPAT
jgi:O-antigen ligase/polysaccharide polymerase Wzy-like membrane protein